MSQFDHIGGVFPGRHWSSLVIIGRHRLSLAVIGSHRFSDVPAKRRPQCQLFVSDNQRIYATILNHLSLRQI